MTLRRALLWTAVGAVAFVALAAATTRAFYAPLPRALRIPGFVPPPIVRRKIYALVVFAVAGALAALARRRDPALTGALASGLLSTGIEVAQQLHGTHETGASSTFDIVSGLLGGAFGGWLVRIARSTNSQRRRG